MEAIFEHPPVFHVGQRVYVRHTGCSPSMPTALAVHIGRHGTVVDDSDGMYTVVLDKYDKHHPYNVVEHMEPATVRFYATELGPSNM